MRRVEAAPRPVVIRPSVKPMGLGSSRGGEMGRPSRGEKFSLVGQPRVDKPRVTIDIFSAKAKEPVRKASLFSPLHNPDISVTIPQKPQSNEVGAFVALTPRERIGRDRVRMLERNTRQRELQPFRQELPEWGRAFRKRITKERETEYRSDVKQAEKVLDLYRQVLPISREQAQLRLVPQMEARWQKLGILEAPVLEPAVKATAAVAERTGTQLVTQTDQKVAMAAKVKEEELQLEKKKKEEEEEEKREEGKKRRFFTFIYRQWDKLTDGYRADVILSTIEQIAQKRRFLKDAVYYFNKEHARDERDVVNGSFGGEEVVSILPNLQTPEFKSKTIYQIPEINPRVVEDNTLHRIISGIRKRIFKNKEHAENVTLTLIKENPAVERVAQVTTKEFGDQEEQAVFYGSRQLAPTTIQTRTRRLAA